MWTKIEDLLRCFPNLAPGEAQVPPVTDAELHKAPELSPSPATSTLLFEDLLTPAMLFQDDIYTQIRQPELPVDSIVGEDLNYCPTGQILSSTTNGIQAGGMHLNDPVNFLAPMPHLGGMDNYHFGTAPAPDYNTNHVVNPQYFSYGGTHVAPHESYQGCDPSNPAKQHCDMDVITYTGQLSVPYEQYHALVCSHPSTMMSLVLEPHRLSHQAVLWPALSHDAAQYPIEHIHRCNSLPEGLRSMLEDQPPSGPFPRHFLRPSVHNASQAPPNTHSPSIHAHSSSLVQRTSHASTVPGPYTRLESSDTVGGGPTEAQPIAAAPRCYTSVSVLPAESGSSTLQCPRCLRPPFTLKRNLTRHLRTQHGFGAPIIGYICQICGYDSPQRCNVPAHLRAIHKLKPTKEYLDECKLSLRTAARHDQTTSRSSVVYLSPPDV